MSNKIKLALLSGGSSGEREISLKTGQQIKTALNKDKYDITTYDPKYDMLRIIQDIEDKKIDMVYPALHGPFGEDGRLQGLLDMFGVPYVFSSCLASALAMNKPLAKVIAQANGLTICDFQNIEKSDYSIYEIIKNLGLPIVVKPSELGSSVGMSLAKTETELKKGILEALKYSDKIMLEKYVSGRELTCAVLQNKDEIKTLPIIEIKPKTSTWFDYEAKYTLDASEEICPAVIPDDIAEKVNNYSLNIFKALGCKDLARADFIWNEENGEIYFLEINTIPGMTATSLAPKAAQASGYNFSEFLDILINNNL